VAVDEESIVSSIQIERVRQIAVLRIDRPPAIAIDLDLANEFATALEGVESIDGIAALIVTGAGNCFSAGLDLKALPSYDRAQQQAMVMQVNRLFGGLYGLRLPTIAAVNGHAIAGGVILTLCCDYRIGAEGDYKLGLAEARVGVPFSGRGNGDRSIRTEPSGLANDGADSSKLESRRGAFDGCSG
jgi:enoyl-CoA hydratase